MAEILKKSGTLACGVGQPFGLFDGFEARFRIQRIGFRIRCFLYVARMVGWVFGLGLESQAFGLAFFLSCGLGWVFGLLDGFRV